jgi:hypothetical protein
MMNTELTGAGASRPRRVRYEDMGWTAEEAEMLRRIDPAVRDRVLGLLEEMDNA